MSQHDNVFSIKLIKKGNKLRHLNTGEFSLYNEFVKGLEEGQIVESFFEAQKNDGTNPQLAKIHACIRKLSTELGYTFEEMKKTIKCQSGLCWTGKDNTEYYKSFADCSKEELALVIEAINTAGEMVNITF
jgi:hypothetical protein